MSQERGVTAGNKSSRLIRFASTDSDYFIDLQVTSSEEPGRFPRYASLTVFARFFPGLFEPNWLAICENFVAGIQLHSTENS